MRDTSSAVSAIAERRDDLAGLVTNTNTAFRAIGDAERLARPRARAAAGHAAQGQHDVREPALDARRPRSCWSTSRSPRPRTWRRFLSELRPLVRDGTPDGRRPAHADPQARPRQRPDRADGQAAAARAADRVGVPARDPHAQRRPAGVRVLPRLHARLHLLDLELRPGGGQLRRQRPLRARPADVPAGQLRGRHAHGAPTRRRSSTGSSATSRTAARVASSRPPPTAAARSTSTTATRRRPREAADLDRPVRGDRALDRDRDRPRGDRQRHARALLRPRRSSTTRPTWSRARTSRSRASRSAWSRASRSPTTRRPPSRCASTTRTSSPGRATPAA